MAILLKTQNLDKRVMDLIYDKQRDFTKEKGRRVSLESTVNRLLKDAYLSSECDSTNKGASPMNHE